MTSRYPYQQDPQQRGRLTLFRTGAAAGIVIAVLAVAALLASDNAPGDAAGTEFSEAATPTIATPPARVPEHIREAPGIDPLYPHEYIGQLSVF